MKDEFNRILEYLICDDELHHIRNWLYPLNASNLIELDEAIEQLSDAISQINLNNHEHTGMYHLFLGCLFYEKNMNQMAIQHAQSAIRQMWDSTVNKALAHWLLGLIFSNIGDSPKARHELQNALKLLAANSSLNSPRANREKRSRQTIQQDIGNTLKQFLQQPIFRTVRPDPASAADRFPIQNPPVDEENGTPISLHIPISITNEFNPINTNSFKSHSRKNDRIAQRTNGRKRANGRK